nr:MAG TPA_asm: hypothetical protein [Caudoviricetes sp.]
MSCRGADSNRASIRRRDLNTPIHGARLLSRAPAKGRTGGEERRWPVRLVLASFP